MKRITIANAAFFLLVCALALWAQQPVSVSSALPAGTNVIGHVINDSGSTTVVTGNVTVIQPTGTNLHAVMDSGSTTAVTGNVAVTKADGSDVTTGAKADAKSTATDTTPISLVSIFKEISAMEQAPASRAVTNAGTFAVQAAVTAASGSIASGAIASGAVASGAIASGAVASGAFASGSVSDGAMVTMGNKADAKSTSTDTTAVSLISILKEISAMLQAPAALPNNQSVNVAQVAGQTTTTTDNGTQGVAPVPTTSSTAAVSACNILSAASTNATNCKNAAGNFYGYEVFNNTTTIYYLRLYNSSSAPTCSSSTGFIRTIPIPPAAASGQAGGAISNQIFPVAYGTGISYCLTGGSGSTDNTNAAVGVFGEIRYK